MAKLTTQGKKYLDQSRFPKVAIAGYENDFKKDYSKQMKSMVKDLASKTVDLQKDNENKIENL